MTPTVTPAPSADADPGSLLPTAETISCDTMLDPSVDASLRAENLVPYEHAFTVFNFEPRGLAIQCPWGPPGSQGGWAGAYYTWAELLPGDREVILALAQESPYALEETAEGTRLVFTGEEIDGHNSEILVTDHWYASATGETDEGRSISDILWTR